MYSPLKKIEVGLDAVEGGAVGHVEDRPRLQVLARLNDLHGHVHLQVVHEDGELLPKELGRENFHDLNEIHGGDGLGMDGVGFEPTVVADRAEECHGLDPDVGVVHLDALIRS